MFKKLFFLSTLFLAITTFFVPLSAIKESESSKIKVLSKGSVVLDNDTMWLALAVTPSKGWKIGDTIKVLESDINVVGLSNSPYILSNHDKKSSVLALPWGKANFDRFVGIEDIYEQEAKYKILLKSGQELGVLDLTQFDLHGKPLADIKKWRKGDQIVYALKTMKLLGSDSKIYEGFLIVNITKSESYQRVAEIKPASVP